MIYEVSEKKSSKDAVKIELTELDEGKYEVQIGGETIHVDAVKSGRTIYSVIENGRQYEVSVDEKGTRDFDVLVRGKLFHLEAVDERSRLLAQTSKMATSGPQTVEAEARIARGLLENVWPMLDSGRIAPIIHSTFPLTQAAQAHAALEAGDHVGKFVLTVD